MRKILNRVILRGASAVFWMLGASIDSARAGLLSEELVKTNCPGIYSNEKGQEIAVPFAIPTRASITHLTWYGAWLGSGARRQEVAPTLRRFNVRVLPDSPGGPGDVPLFSQIVVAKAQSTGQKMNPPIASGDAGDIIYRFDADISPSITVAAGTNWLSVIALHPAGAQWLWARSAMGPSELRWRVLSGSPQWTHDSNLGLTAFAIQGALLNQK